MFEVKKKVHLTPRDIICLFSGRASWDELHKYVDREQQIGPSPYVVVEELVSPLLLSVSIETDTYVAGELG